MGIDKGWMAGSTAMLLLRLLEERDRYGYQMIEELRRRSDHTFDLKAGTLYPLLHGLEEKGWITSYQGEGGGRTRKYYHLTEKGRRELKEKRAKAAYMDGIDSLEEYKQNKLLIQKERETLAESLKQLEAAGPEENADSGSQERQMLDHIRSVTDILRSDRFSALQKNVALRSIVDRIVFHKDTMHIDVFYYLKEQSREQDPRKPA